MKHTKIALSIILLITLTFSACLPGPKEPGEQEVFAFVDEIVNTEQYSYIDNTKGQDRTTYRFRSTQRDLSFEATSYTSGNIKDLYDVFNSGSGIHISYWENIYTKYYREEFKKIVGSYFDSTKYDYKDGTLVLSNYNKSFNSGPTYTIKIENKNEINNFLQAYSEINAYYLTKESQYHKELPSICHMQIAMDTIDGKEVTGAYYETGDSFIKKTEKDILDEFAYYMIHNRSYGIFSEEEIQSYIDKNPEWLKQYKDIYFNEEKAVWSDNNSWIQYNEDTKKWYVAIKEFSYKENKTSVLLDYLTAFGIPCTDYTLGTFTSEAGDDENSYFKFESNGNTYDITVFNTEKGESDILILKNNAPMQCDTYYAGSRYVYVDLESFCEMINADYTTRHNYEFHFTSKLN